MNLLNSILLAIILSIVSCGKENPFDGKDSGVQTAIRPDLMKKVTGDGESVIDVIANTADGAFTFTENTSSEFSMSGIVRVPGAGLILSIENLNDFPQLDGKSALFDSATGVFTWRPPVGFVQDLGMQRMDLKVWVTTTQVSPERSFFKVIPVFVKSVEKAPEVISIDFEKGQNSIREGEAQKLDIVIRDITGIDTDGGRPTISFLSDQKNEVEMSSFIYPVVNTGQSNPEPLPNDKTLWVFHYQLDLTAREITTTLQSLPITVQSRSRRGNFSSIFSKNITIFPKLADPIISWIKPQEMKVGQGNIFKFTVVDIRGTSSLAVNFPDCSLINSALACGPCTQINQNGLEGVECSIEWNIPADYLLKGGSSAVNLKYTIESKSKVPNDPYILPKLTKVGVINAVN